MENYVDMTTQIINVILSYFQIRILFIFFKCPSYRKNKIKKNARVCVSKCPEKGDITLNCKPNSLVSTCNFNPLNKYYDSYA